MRHVICVTVLLCGALGCDNSNSPNTQKNSKDNAQPTSKSNEPEDDSKIALAKFKKIVAGLSKDSLISPKNEQSGDTYFFYYRNVKSSGYDVIPSSSLLSGYTGEYYQTQNSKQVDKEPNRIVYETPVMEFLQEMEYIFDFNKESKRWEFNRRKSTSTRLTDKRIGNKITDYAGTKKYSEETLSDFTPEFRKAIEKCVNAQDK